VALERKSSFGICAALSPGIPENSPWKFQKKTQPFFGGRGKKKHGEVF